MSATAGIGTLAEGSLHAQTKQWLAEPGDRFEVPVGRYVIDVVRGNDLIEVQTGNFSAMKRKLPALLNDHHVTVWYPLAVKKWIRRVERSGELRSRRRSPKSGRVIDVFDQLVSIPMLLDHPNLTIGVLKTHQEQTWLNDGKGSWRRGRWSIADTTLIDVVGAKTFNTPEDLVGMLPPLLGPFTNRELADAASIRLRLAQRVTYTLSRCGGLDNVGKTGNSNLFALPEK